MLCLLYLIQLLKTELSCGLFAFAVLVYGKVYFNAICFIVLYGLTELFFKYYLSEMCLTVTLLHLKVSNSLRDMRKMWVDGTDWKMEEGRLMARGEEKRHATEKNRKCLKFGIISRWNKMKTLYSVCKTKLTYHNSTMSMLQHLSRKHPVHGADTAQGNVNVSISISIVPDYLINRWNNQ